ncbi:MAG TPA: esterase, partial [Balneola sp.]|nr:esterase [Balneola sp.]
MSEKKKVHLVLGSGGARGVAHIGVIEELEKEGYEIIEVIGCSMGAVVGGIYCAGQLPEYN